MIREAMVERNTLETKIKVSVLVDGEGEATLTTGIGFLDHMLTLFAKQSFMDIRVEASGDLETGSHHTVEDVAITLGLAIKEALGDKKGIARYGNTILPMDDTLMICAIDLSGRPWLNMDVEFTVPYLGTMETEMFKEFFYALAVNTGMNLHFKQLSGSNNHHIAEAMFKALGQAFDKAVTLDPRIEGVHSTKGTL